MNRRTRGRAIAPLSTLKNLGDVIPDTDHELPLRRARSGPTDVRALANFLFFRGPFGR